MRARRNRWDVDALVAGVLAGSRAQIAKAITLVESSRPEHRVLARDLLGRLRPHTGGAVRLGISGVPGAGKSTFIDAIGTRLIDRGHKVAVLAVDPSSAKTGGSILGDRTRMGELSTRDEAFVRPSPSGCHLGGVARATRESIFVVESAGYDVVIVETVGVGQSEIAVAGMVDTFLLLHLARSGDQLQGIKRGILEIANVIAVNKADGENVGEARVAARDLKTAMKLMIPERDERPEVLTCSAYTGDGLDDVWAAIEAHRAGLVAAGELETRRADQQLTWLWALVQSELDQALRGAPSVVALRKPTEEAVRSGQVSAVEAAEEILAAFATDLPGMLQAAEDD